MQGTVPNMSSWYYETDNENSRIPEQEYAATGNCGYYPPNAHHDRSQYRNAESKNEQQPNTADLQHGVTYHVQYATPIKGLPIVGTTQQWATSTDLVQQGYQQRALISPKNAEKPHNVRHNTAPDSLLDNNNIPVGVGKLVKAVPTLKFTTPKADRVGHKVKEPSLVPPDITNSEQGKAGRNFLINSLSPDYAQKITSAESKLGLLSPGQRLSGNSFEQTLDNQSDITVSQNFSLFYSELSASSKNLVKTCPKLNPTINPGKGNSNHQQVLSKANLLSDCTRNAPGQASSSSDYNFVNQNRDFCYAETRNPTTHSQNTKGCTENQLPNFTNLAADYKSISTNDYFNNYKASFADTNADKVKEFENYLSNVNSVKHKEHSRNKNPDLENYYYTKHNKQLDYSLLKHSDLNGHSTRLNSKNEVSDLNRNGNFDSVTETSFEKNNRLHLISNKSLSVQTGVKTKDHSQASSNFDVNRVSSNKQSHYITNEVNIAKTRDKTEVLAIVNNCKVSPSFLEDFEMSGQYPGHSRPPVGTPPPQTVWNHLTMAQGQGLNIHPTALPGAALNPPGFYTHPSMARASHLTSQLTPQLAHTQAPPTWHTPTVPAKPVTPSNAPGNPLFSLQMLVDNRQNQNLYRNSPGVQSTLDLSATSDMAENYSRIPQDIPISLTARSADKVSRNGSIISPPIPLNGETSSDSGISSSVPTPNSVCEPVSLSTREITTPKISVKNFESNLKGVANLHDKVKELTMDNFAQKVINLPPSVTIERVTTDKKDSELVQKTKDSLSVIAQMPRTILPVIVNLTSKAEKDVTDSPKRDPSEFDKKIEESGVRSPKNPLKRGNKKGIDSLLEKLEGGTKNIGSVIVMPVEEKDTSSVKSASPDRQKSKSPSREDDVVSPSFSNEDSNDNTKQRRKRKLEKPVRLSKDSKTEVEDMELEPTEPSEPRTNCEPVPEVTNSLPVSKPEERIEENQPIRRRRSSEGPASNVPPTNQRARRKSSDDATEFSKVTSPRGVNNANPFNEVESELEKMFAGIVETDTDVKKDVIPKAEVVPTTEAKETKETVTNTEADEYGKAAQLTDPTDVSSTVDTKTPVKIGKKGKGRGGKRKISRSSDNIFGSSGGEYSPQKDMKKRRASKGSKKQEVAKKTKKNTKIDGLREMAYDSGSNASSIRSRGPVVHVEGPRDSPLSVQVVNAPSREDEEEKNKEKRKNVGNGNAGRSKRLSHQNDLDYRGKVSRAGLFCSTLSSRYDAHTTDSTWVCVFCKQGPHSVVPGDPLRPHPNLAGPHIAPGTYMVPAGVLSDLFGPYLIGKERCDDGILSADEQEIMTEQRKGGKNKRSLRHAGLADQFAAKMGKKKRNSMEGGSNAVLTGMTQLPGDEQRWEVWLHEQCAVWAAGVYMAGGRVTGLQEAVWDAAKSVCGSCGLTGANVGCVKRGCRSVIHYPCALTKGWLLDTSQYIPKCNVHRVT